MSISTVDGDDYNVKYFEYELKHSVDQYKNKDLILCCFAVNDVDSYNKLDSEYIAEVNSRTVSFYHWKTKYLMINLVIVYSSYSIITDHIVNPYFEI